MSALTLWQPWASLCVLPRPAPSMWGHDAVGHGPPPARPFKTIETRSWPAPTALIGQRIAIHAAARKVPGVDRLGDSDYWYDTFGMWTETATSDGRNVITVPWPLGAVVGTAVLVGCVPMVDVVGPSYERAVVLGDDGEAWLHRMGEAPTGVHDQFPFGDFRPGRWAWLLADVEQLTEPIPARGGQRIWKWRT